MAFNDTPFYDNMADGLVILGGGVLYKYKGESPSSVTIPSNVKSITSYAFADCDTMTSICVDHGNSVYSSIDGLLYNKAQTKLIRCPVGKRGAVVLPQSVTDIGACAFFCCSNLTSVALPSGVTNIGHSAFFRCSQLKTLAIPEQVKSVGSEAFACCNALKTPLVVDRARLDCLDGKLTIGGYTWSYAIKNGEATIVAPRGERHCAVSPSPIGHIDIPSTVNGFTVTAVGHSAFDKCRGLTSVSIPSTVKNVGDGAFWWCHGLEQVIFSGGVTNIGSGAFAECRALSSIVLPHTVKAIGSYAFGHCWGLSSIRMPRELICVGADAFYCCGKLSSVTMPTLLSNIGNRAFADCNQLRSLTMSGVPPTMGVNVFTNCSHLTTVRVLANREAWAQMKTWQDRPLVFVAETDCSNDESEDVQISTDNAKNIASPSSGDDGRKIVEGRTNANGYRWAYRAWNGEAMIVKLSGDEFSCAVSPRPNGHVEIPATLAGAKVTHIGPSAFQDCNELTSVTIPSTVTHIGNGAFYDCHRLQSVGLSSELVDIGHSAFYGCWGVSSIVVPKTVSSIGRWSFGHSGITNITLPSKLTSIASHAFCGCNGLRSIKIPSGVVRIGECAFSYCTKLTSVTLPSKVINVGDCVFSGCNEMLNIKVEADSRHFASINGALYTKDLKTLVACPGGVSSVTVPSSVNDIRETAFRECGALKQINVDVKNRKYTSVDGVLYAEGGATLLVCPCKADAITIPSGVSHVADYAFYRCDALSSVMLPPGITDIGEYAVSCCRRLESVMIPQSVVRIGERAFEYSDRLESVSIPSGVRHVEDKVFQGCTGLKSVTLQEGVTSIGIGAFSECAALTSMTIPASVTVLGNNAFEECKGLTSVTMCGERPDSGSGIFASCNRPTIHVSKDCKSWTNLNRWKGCPLVFDASLK